MSKQALLVLVCCYVSFLDVLDVYADPAQQPKIVKEKEVLFVLEYEHQYYFRSYSGRVIFDPEVYGKSVRIEISEPEELAARLISSVVASEIKDFNEFFQLISASDMDAEVFYKEKNRKYKGRFFELIGRVDYGIENRVAVIVLGLVDPKTMTVIGVEKIGFGYREGRWEFLDLTGDIVYENLDENNWINNN